MGFLNRMGFRKSVGNSSLANHPVSEPVVAKRDSNFVVEIPVIMQLSKGDLVHFVYNAKQRVGAVDSYDPATRNLLVNDFDAKHPKNYKVTQIEKMHLIQFPE